GNTFLTIMLVGNTQSSGDAGADFAKQWHNFHASTSVSKSAPKPERVSSGNVVMLGGVGEITLSSGGRAKVMLNTVTANNRLLTLVGTFTDAALLKEYQQFIQSIELDDAFTAQGNALNSAPAAPPATARAPSAATSTAPRKLFYPSIFDLRNRCNRFDGEVYLTPSAIPPAQHVECREKSGGRYGRVLFNDLGVP
ncbi:MAG: hypothetical protein ACRDAM_19495, partial [Casimicrobium sp.]